MSIRQTRLCDVPVENTVITMSVTNRNVAIEDAMWATCSPHEHHWTQEQARRMAFYCLWAAREIAAAAAALELTVERS